MKSIGLRSLATTVVVAIAIACTPALDWRDVRLEGLQAMLPCKPDRGARIVQLGDHALRMQMAGCEASGAMYAISHVRLLESSQANEVQAAWRTAALGNIHGSVVTPQAENTAISGTGSLRKMLVAHGNLPDGKPVEARLLWLAANNNLYHVAVYGPKLDNERLDMLLTDLRVQ